MTVSAGTWFAALRAPFVTATLATVLWGALWPGFEGAVAVLVVAAGAVLAHLAANVFNDWADHHSGADEANVGYVPGLSGGSRLIQKGRITPRATFMLGLGLLAAAAVCGVVTLGFGGPRVLGFALAGALLGLGYTVPPLRLVHRGFGEVVIFLAFGPLLGGGAYVATHGGAWPPAGVWIGSSVMGLWVAMILLVNEFPDRAGDAVAGKRTWVVRFGPRAASRVYAGFYLLSVVLLVGGVAGGALPVWTLAGLVMAPLAWRNWQLLTQRLDAPTTELAPACMGTVQAHLWASVAMLLTLPAV